MERMQNMLYEAAMRGSVTTLLELLQQDRLILDRIVMNCPLETPLHVATLRGHVSFVKEILGQMPQLANELDSRQSSPLHIASQKGYVDIVKALLQVNPDLCLAPDVEGMNPLHLAAMKGRIDVLIELVRVRSQAAYATTYWGETILHLCVKHNQFEALKLLLQNIEEPHLLNAKDDYGMTILHLAVADRRIQVVQFLTTSTTIEVNAQNANGFTALDILAQSKRDTKDWEIGELLRRAQAVGVKDNIQFSTTNNLTSHQKDQKGQKAPIQHQAKDMENFFVKQDDWLERKRNALMVVASLIATMAFQASVSPPHSPWQNAPQSGMQTSEPPMASPPQNFEYSYCCFIFYNTIGFMAALSIILLLISGLPLKRKIFMWILMVIMWVAITAMGITYVISINFLKTPDGLRSSAPNIVFLIWIGMAGLLVLSHIIRATMKMIKYVAKLVSRLSGSSAWHNELGMKCPHDLYGRVDNA